MSQRMTSNDFSTSQLHKTNEQEIKLLHTFLAVLKVWSLFKIQGKAATSAEGETTQMNAIPKSDFVAKLSYRKKIVISLLLTTVFPQETETPTHTDERVDVLLDLENSLTSNIHTLNVCWAFSHLQL